MHKCPAQFTEPDFFLLLNLITAWAILLLLQYKSETYATFF